MKRAVGWLLAGLVLGVLGVWRTTLVVQSASSWPIVPSFGEISEFSLPGTNSAPRGITPGSDGNLWFTEYYRNQIGRITPNGSLTEFSLPTPSRYPSHITSGPDDNLWFTEVGVHKIGRMTPIGTLTEFSLPTTSGSPFGITAGPDGNIWFTEIYTTQIGRITPTGSITEFPVSGAHGSPGGITAGPDGNLWFTEITDGIGRITPAGTVTDFPVPTISSEPWDITLSPDGNLWFTEVSSSKIGRITSAGVIVEFPLSMGEGPQDITTGPDGNLWFTGWNQIGRLTPNGALTDFPLPTPASAPEGITIGGDGNIWFTEYNGNKIGRFQLALVSPTPTPPSSTPTRTATPAPRPTATPTPACDELWTLAPSQNPGNLANNLGAVTALASNNAWMVGWTADSPGPTYRTLVEHWDGNQWQTVSSPNRADLGDRLYGVAAVAPADIWAVGESEVSTTSLTLVEHWDGTSWTIVPSPSPASSTHLVAVAASSATDVWAVGYANPGSGAQTLIEHWDGTQWSVSLSPNVPNALNQLRGVVALAADDVWAVGETDPLPGGSPRALIEHWDGQQWTIVPGPTGTMVSQLSTITAVSARDVWAVGMLNNQPLVEHWDGQQWTILPCPAPTGVLSFSGVASAGANDLWAVAPQQVSDWVSVPLLAHWDGVTWSFVVGPIGSPNFNWLSSVAFVGPAAGWAVGTAEDNGAPSQTLVLAYTPSCITPTPEAATATRTATPRSPTPTPAAGTATPCVITFSDVQPTDYFYEPVRYLACRGVISGYASGTFRPYAGTTRAQQVKIVVLGFARPLQTPAGGAYTFADVPPSQPFYPYVETAAALGVVGGYPCGGPGEPCDGQGRRYFRPNAAVTRGQLAKMTVLTAGWPLLNPAQPTFADVPAGSAFYPFVETAVCRGIVSGYADGTFRPGAGATRGQIAKIVYLAVTAPPGACAR